MKKAFFALALLVVAGAGCLQVGKLVGSKEVEGDWYLAFSLPEGWVMTRSYQEPDEKAVYPTPSVSRADSEIYLQSTDKAIDTDGRVSEEVSQDSYVSLSDSATSLIMVSRLDPRRLLPSDVEDLGNGFYREPGEGCSDTAMCTHSTLTYYFKAEDANYKLIAFTHDEGLTEDIIRSAKVVTVSNEVAE